MKDQYSSNYDDPIVANERLKNKLDFLERQSIKRQNYLKDLERNLKLSRQTVKSLTQKNPAREQIIHQLHQQNSVLVQKLHQQYKSICKLNALFLMQCQLRIQQAKSYNERIKDFQDNMAQLRRYLHDKEESFSFVAQKLKRFQELLPNQQITMYEKLINYSAIVKQQIRWKDVFNQVLQDRDVWKKKSEQNRQKCQKLQVLIQSIKQLPDFDKFENLVNNLSNQQSNKIYLGMINNSNNANNHHLQNKNQANQSTNLTYSQGKKLSIEPNVQLIRLMKKQKLSNKILESALTQAIDNNLELIECNKRLVQSNDDLRAEMDYIIADMVVICNALTKFDQNYKTKLRILKYKAKCDLQMPSYKEIIEKYKSNSLEQAKQILFMKMRNDVQQMTQYIALCPIQKTNKIRSYQSPKKMYRQQQKLQISMNDKQLEVSEI